MSRLKIVFLAVLLPSLFVACGKNQQRIVTHIDVQERIIDDKVFIDVKADLDLGNVILPPMKVPVRIPSKGKVGEVELGVDFVKVSVALSEIVHLQLEDAVLPNGEKLPLIADNKVVVIPLDHSGKFLLYISLVGGAKAIGLTIPVKELDKLGQQLKDPAGFFPPLRIMDFTVFAGIYTSPVAGENGLGIFTDLNPLFRILEAQGRWFELSQNVGQLNFETTAVNKKKDQLMKQYLFKLHSQSKELTVPMY